MSICGAKTKSGKPCQQHPMTGATRCRIHGGATPVGVDSPAFKHGRYSKHLPERISKRINDFADSDPLDLIPELDIQRALFAEHVSKFREGVPLAAMDISYLMEWAGDIGRMVERIVKMRNDTALTGAEVAFLAARVADVVAKYIHDPDIQSRFVADLLNVTSEPARADQPALTSG